MKLARDAKLAGSGMGALGICLSLLGWAGPSAGADEALDGLRMAHATHYFSADSHLALARALADRGERVRAFFVCENARRTLFTPEDFAAAHRKAFLKPDPFDNSPGAEAALREKLQGEPDDAGTLIRLADVYISRSDWAHARPLLMEAIGLRPGDFQPVFALAEVERRERGDKEAEAITARFVKDHPTAADSYGIRIRGLAEKDPEAAGALADEAVEKYPKDSHLRVLLASLAYQRHDDAVAVREFVEAARLAPDSADVQGRAGRFFLKGRKQPDRALEYYLRAYFLDPEYYDGEYAEGRIRSIEYGLAADRVLAAADLGSLLRDSDPVVVGLALEGLSKEWKREALDGVVRLLRDDDTSLRWNAMRLVSEQGGNAIEARLPALLEDPDLRARGMALYILARVSGKKALPLLRATLTDRVELMRYDALSALLMHGGEEGKAIVQEYALSGKEPCLAIRERIQGALKER